MECEPKKNKTKWDRNKNIKYIYKTDPEESRVAVPDARFDWLVQHYKPAKEIPAFVRFFFLLYI